MKIPTQAILDPEQLFETIDTISDKYDAIVVDGPAGLSEVTKSILDVVDLALVQLGESNPPDFYRNFRD
ncbi:ParA family protein [Crocosphaera watsonii WH 8501]|uniref:ParA family protein n=1 Tax=Crocosphaera watsonii TaxID=263511 RepID=UPI000039C3AC|nr:ParA family protein [Crocosphaera watsonii]